MTYPIETEVEFMYHFANKKTGGAIGYYVKATVTDYGPQFDIAHYGRYLTELHAVYRGALNLLPILDELHNAGELPHLIDEICKACEIRALEQQIAAAAHWNDAGFTFKNGENA